MAPGPGQAAPPASARPPRLWLALLALCLPAWWLGVRATGRLDWPEDADLYRDIAQAETFARGRLLADPFYAGEGLWYNPLVPLLVAGGARASGQPVHVLYTRLGPFLNLLAPLAFGLLLARLSGPAAGLAAAFAFAYLGDPREPPWASPTYSPWLFSASFAQGLFCLTLLAHGWARGVRRPGWASAAAAIRTWGFLRDGAIRVSSMCAMSTRASALYAAR